MAPEEFRLHAVIHRLVFRSVLTQQHLMEAIARSGSTPEAERDPLGDLLLIGHLLTPLAFEGAAARARTKGTSFVLSELERLLTQHPYVRGANPVSERFLPDSLGTDPPLSNPYLTTILAVLEGLAVSAGPSIAEPSGAEEDVAVEGQAPFWWSSVREAISRIAARQMDAPPILEAGPDPIPDRFEMIIADPAKHRAARLLERFGGSPPPSSCLCTPR
jgi:hypothetical protein